MNYVSTRDKSIKVSAAKAIAQGISVEGGLFVPDTFPLFTADDFKKLSELDYKGKAKFVLKCSVFIECNLIPGFISTVFFFIISPIFIVFFILPKIIQINSS